METIHRYTRKTITKQFWEMCLIEKEDKIFLNKIHVGSDGVTIIKEVETEITQKQAEDFKTKNKDYHIETYTKNPN